MHCERAIAQLPLMFRERYLQESHGARREQRCRRHSRGSKPRSFPDRAFLSHPPKPPLQSPAAFGVLGRARRTFEQMSCACRASTAKKPDDRSHTIERRKVSENDAERARCSACAHTLPEHATTAWQESGRATTPTNRSEVLTGSGSFSKGSLGERHGLFPLAPRHDHFRYQQINNKN